MSELYGLFSWKTLLTKAGVNATATAVIFAVVGYISHGRATNDWAVTPDLQSVINMGIAAGMAALWAAGRNCAKNHPSSPLSKVFMTVAVVVAGMCLQGCATAGLPATLSKPVQHHTEIQTQMAPTVDEKGNVIPGETYHYVKDWKGGAGVQSEGSDNLDIGIDPDGSWHIRQGASSKLDTSGQITGIIEGAKINAEAQDKAFEKSLQLVGIVAQLVGVKLSNDAAIGASDAANKAALQQMIGEIVKEALKEQKPKTPKPVVSATPEPVVTLPGN